MILTYKTTELALVQEENIVEFWISFPMYLESSHSDIGVKNYDQNTAGRRNWTSSMNLRLYDFVNYFDLQDGRPGSRSVLKSCR